MLKVPEWPKIAAKPMAKALRSHVLWGIVACLAMFGGSYQLLLQGQRLDSLGSLSLLGAFLVLLTGFVRLYLGGSGRWHLYVACLAIAVFGIRLLANVESLGMGFLALSKPAAATPTAASTWRGSIAAHVTSGGVRRGQKTLGVVMQGKISGKWSGKATFTINEVALNNAGMAAELSGKGKLETAGSGSYRGGLLGVVHNDGTGELLLNTGGLEAVATFKAPAVWTKGEAVILSLEVQPGGNLPVPAFRSATPPSGAGSPSQPSQPVNGPPSGYAQPQSGC